MAEHCAKWTTAVSHGCLCAVALYSAVYTFQVNRGAAAGFFLQAITSAVGAACFLLAPLGLHLESLVVSGAWMSSVIGRPLLAFGFHWLHGDHSTANGTLVCGLLLAAGFHSFTAASRQMVAHSVTLAASISTLIISILVGNCYGILGSVTVGTTGLIPTMKADQLLLLWKDDVLNYALLVGMLAFQKAFRTLNLDLV
ncbi:transmembrane protein 276 isoform X2 [Ambystoma mexicanum]|uniref:transmembrane protein 276 isoform X2 n=1 Tax=Ambystoma mexicanum TaxID=8296 RepID=UPI0037E712BB